MVQLTGLVLLLVLLLSVGRVLFSKRHTKRCR